MVYNLFKSSGKNFWYDFFFITDICLHFDKSSLMPFLFDTIITAKYCE